jgi:Cupredoxin-like domain
MCRSALVFLVPFMLASVATARAEDVPTLELSLTGTTFTPAELHVPVGKTFVIKFKNNNATAAELEAKDVKIEKVVPANGEIVVRVKATKAGKFLFVNEYQEDVAKGYIVAE